MTTKTEEEPKEKKKSAADVRREQNVADVVTLALAATSIYRSRYARTRPGAEDGDDKRSVKARKAEAIINEGWFGCQSKAVASLASGVLGEKVTYSGETSIPVYAPYMSVVRVVHSGLSGHGFPVGSLGIIIRADTNGSAYGVASLTGRSTVYVAGLNPEVVPATDEEVKTLITSAFIKSIMGAYQSYIAASIRNVFTGAY